MSKIPTNLELFALLPSEERGQFLLKLLPHLQEMFGDVYNDYKDELEATYGAHKKLEEGK